MIRTLTIALMFVLLAGAADAESQQVRAAFVVPGQLPSVRDLQKAREDGFNLIVLQYTRSTENSLNVNRISTFVRRAERAGIDYMLGLHYVHTWEEEWQKNAPLEAHVQSNVQIIRELQVGMMRRQRFKGWYLPLELGNSSEGDDQALVNAFTAIRSASAAPMALSLYYNPDPDYLPPDSFVARITPLVRLFDIVLMQDGVGERNIIDYPGEVEPFYRAVRDVVVQSGHRFWGIVEGFTCTAPDAEDRQCPDNDPRPPAPPSRFCGQVAAVRPYTDGLVAYNMGEVLHPRGRSLGKQAYDAYVSAMMGRPCPPSP